MLPTVAANGAQAFGQYKPSLTGSGYDPRALQVLEIVDGRIVGFTFFLDTERVCVPALRPARPASRHSAQALDSSPCEIAGPVLHVSAPVAALCWRRCATAPEA